MRIRRPAADLDLPAPAIMSAFLRWGTPHRAPKELDVRGSSAAVAIGANGFHQLPILPLDAEHAGALTWPHGFVALATAIAAC